MTDDTDTQNSLPSARRIHTRWPGLVWAIPLAALLIVAYLGVRALTRRGVNVTVTFSAAEGVTPGDTKVLVNGVEAGHVTKVRVSEDRHHVDVTLALDPRERGSLNSNTKFWLIGENPTITDIQSIRAAVAGVIIGMAPGTGGTPTRMFTGLDSPPLVPPGTPGKTYVLQASHLGSLQPGAAIVYRGLTIGKVLSSQIVSLDQFRLPIFIQAPYDGFIRSGAVFWTASPLKLSLSGGSISAGLATPSSVLQGAVEFELPSDARTTPVAAAGTVFTLFDDGAAARQGEPGPAVAYRLAIPGAAGDLSIGSNVTMAGYAVGTVQSAQLKFDPAGRPYTEAVIQLFGRRLGATIDERTSAPDIRNATNIAINHLLSLGYRAKMAQSPPFVGAHVVSLALDTHARPRLLADGPVPTIPMAAASDSSADDLMDKADQILTKVNALPLQEIGNNVRRLTGNVAAITGSPQVHDSIVHLDATLRQLDQITADVRPRVGPLMAKLNQTADQLQGTAVAARAMLSGEGAAQDRSLPDAIQQLNEAARSIRGLTDYLGRHPEALLRGKAKEEAK